MHPSPLLRYEKPPKPSISGPSPLLREETKRSGAKAKGIALSQRPKQPRKNLLPQVFRQKEIARQSPTLHNLKRGTANPFLSPNAKIGKSIVSPTTPISPYASFAVTSHPARRAAGKHTIVARLEVADSWFIWMILLLPCLTIILALISMQPHRSVHKIIPIDTVVHSYLNQTSSIITLDMQPYMHSFSRQYFQFAIKDKILRQKLADTLLHIHTYVVYNDGAYRDEVLDVELYPVYILDQLTSSPSSTLTFPIPFIDVEHALGYHSIHSWQLQFNLTFSTVANDFFTDSNDILFIIHSTTLSSNYAIFTACMAIIISCCSIALFAVSIRQIIRQSAAAYEEVSQSLPLSYRQSLSPSHFIIPEQYTCMTALLLLSIACNPFRGVYIIFGFVGDLIPRPLYLYDYILTVIVSFTQHALLFLVVCYTDGLKHNSNPYEERHLLSLLRHDSTDDNTNNLTESLIKSIHRIYLLPHHPRSMQFLDFCMFKLLFLLLTWFVLAVYWAVLFAAVWPHSQWFAFVTEYHNDLIPLANLIMACMTVSWLVWIVRVSWSTAAILRATRYMTSRLRQVAYRAGHFQVVSTLLIMFAWLVYVIQQSKVFSHVQLTSLPAVILFLTGWVEYLGVYEALLPRSVLVVGGYEFMIFVSVVVFCTCISYLPLTPATTFGEAKEEGKDAKQGEQERFQQQILLPKVQSRVFVPLKRLMHRVQRLAAVNIDDNVTDEKPAEDFCLELACHLLEAAYQTYFDSDHLTNSLLASTSHEHLPLASITRESSHASVKRSGPMLQRADIIDTASSVQPRQDSAGPKLDLHRLGLTQHAFFSSPELSTFGFIGLSNSQQQQGDIIVAFRGSTLKNIASDFRFTLMPLPTLQRAKEYFKRMIKENEDNEDKLGMEVGGISEDVDDDLSDSVEDEADGIRHTLNTISTPRYQLLEEGKHGGTTIKTTQPSSQSSLFMRCMKAIPLLNQSFPRVHVGFWESYASIREQCQRELFLLLRKRYRSLVGDYCRRQQERSDKQPSTTPKNRSSDSLLGFYGSLEDVISMDGSGNGSNSSQNGNANNRVSLGRIYLTGHSLGAAMAMLASFEFSLNMNMMLLVLQQEMLRDHPAYTSIICSSDMTIIPPELAVYGFGCPRLGNSAFVSLFEKQISTCYRIIVDGDIVTMVPKFLGFYRHVGQAVLLDEHAAGSIVIQPSILEMSFFKKTIGNIANHSLEKYRRCLEACFEPEDYQEYLAREFMLLEGQQQNDAASTTYAKQQRASDVPEWLRR